MVHGGVSLSIQTITEKYCQFKIMDGSKDGMARMRKRHIQQALVFRTWGGARKGAGRPRAIGRRIESHQARPNVRPYDAVHVSLRVVEDITRLRRRHAYRAIRRAANVVLSRTDFRIVHVSIQANHVHLLVEAENTVALSRGIQAFKISAARQLNKAEAGASWSSPKTPRKGPVFVDRYHAEIISTPRHARHELAYVLNNWRRHREDRAPYAREWVLDPYSTAHRFEGWAETDAATMWRPPDGEEPIPVALPQTWLLREGWKLHRPIGAFEVPGPR